MCSQGGSLNSHGAGSKFGITVHTACLPTTDKNSSCAARALKDVYTGPITAAQYSELMAHADASDNDARVVNVVVADGLTEGAALSSPLKTLLAEHAPSGTVYCRGKLDPDQLIQRAEESWLSKPTRVKLLQSQLLEVRFTINYS